MTNPLRNIWKHRELIYLLTKRELSQRYRGAFLGSLWQIIIPLTMLLIYTIVFGMIFKARWQGMAEDLPPEQFALVLFSGLVPFNIFSEVTNRAPNLIVSVPNYVKKVIFPLELLPVVNLCVALINSLISVILIIIANVIIMKEVSTTLFLLPLAYIPLIFLCLAITWFLSSLGVYIRDIGQGIGIVVQMLFFLSPIFYSASAVPSLLRPVMVLNPLSTIIQNFRQILLWSQPITWNGWAIWTSINVVLALVAYLWFMNTKKGFADVL